MIGALLLQIRKPQDYKCQRQERAGDEIDEIDEMSVEKVYIYAR